ncbi:hypothetical protein DHW03_15095 [Pedobacter yonginense]|uniref:DUF3575 domain-containing protein n=2 Tax=Pedobacter yonginense TaxID=651869 RepID=A0A317EH23_9SPHI|nr:hypothetical protein DHW03_15095 [Pedobacter yonginense]
MTNLKAQQKSKPHFEIEVDPIAYIFNGYSVHIGYQINKLRFDAGFFGIDQPDFVTRNEIFKDRSQGFGIKADYFFKPRKGFFAGIQADYSTDKIIKKDTKTSVISKGVVAGLRGGYRFTFTGVEKDRTGFYFSPWLAVLYTPNAKDIKIEGETFKRPKISLFPTVHFGYSF